MTDRVTEFLASLTLIQLNKLQEKLELRARERAEKRKTAGRLPPIPSNDVGSMAEALGLDISQLMRDVKRRS